MTGRFRKRRTLHLPITLSVLLMSLNVALMVCWIVLLAQRNSWGAMTIGTIIFALILVGLSVYLFITIKEHRLTQRQQNFIDSVTHELKSPIASLQLYLETLQIRELDDKQRAEFYETMESELQRLDHLISQLLEVGRLDAIGHQYEPEDVQLEQLVRRCAETACGHHKRRVEDVFTFETEPTVVHARPMVLEMIFGNLFDNSIKYGADPPKVQVSIKPADDDQIVIEVADNGEGVPHDNRRDVFSIFYRGGSELERKQTGTGLGLYIVRTLLHFLNGKVSIKDRADGSGAVFQVQLPGKPGVCES